MKSLFTLSVICFLCVLSLNASSYPFDITLDEKGYYEASEKDQDLTMSIRIQYGTVNVPVASLKIEVPGKAEPIFDGAVADPKEQIAINTKTRYMKLTVNDPSLAGQTIKFVAEWSFSKDSNAFMSTLKTNKAGQAKYYSDVKSGEFTADNIVVSECCKLVVKADGQKIFSQKVEGGKKYPVNMRFSKSLEYKIKKAPKNKDVTVYMDIFGGAIMQAQQNTRAEAMMDLIGANDYKVQFSATTNDTGCIDTDPYEVDTKGVAPEIRVIAVNQQFENLSVKLNGITFNPEYFGKIGQIHFYIVGVSFKNDKLNVGLLADGGKPLQNTDVTVYCRNQDTGE